MRLFFISLLLLLFTACHDHETGMLERGLLRISSVEVELQTKDDDVLSQVTVYVFGDDFMTYYRYADIPEYIEVPTNSIEPYQVYAQTMSESQAEMTPDEWGQIRYAGHCEVMVNRIDVPVEARVTCTVANAQVSVNFSPEILTYYSDCSLTVSTSEGRTLVFTPSNASDALAYMTAGETVDYVFSGVFNITGEEGSAPRTLALEPAMHYTINVKMGEVESVLGQPDISLNVSCEDVYSTMTVDPSQDGVSNTVNGNE